MKYSSIQINNFRSIADLHIENFKEINLITGINNSGKTTLLEALFLISGMSNPQLPVAINNFRDFLLASDDDFNLIFHNFDFKQKLCLNAVVDNRKRGLKIEPRYTHLNMNLNGMNKINLSAEKKDITSTGVSSAVDGLVLNFKEGDTSDFFRSEISISNGGIGVADIRYKEKLRCTFHNVQYSMSMLPSRIERILVNNEQGGIIEALKEIDNKITAIQAFPSGVIYVNAGFKKLVPINVMGDGIRRILSILASISDMQDGVLLIDEIENGLHYSSLKTLWKAVLKAAAVYNVQLFITTHSYECIAALSDAVNQDSDNIRLYRLEKQSDRHRAFEYTPNMISVGVEENIEMR